MTGLHGGNQLVGDDFRLVGHNDVAGASGAVGVEAVVQPQVSRLPALPRRLRGVITGEFLTDAERAQRRAARQAGGGRPCAIDGDRRVKAYIESAIDGALQDARTAPEGERNQRVYAAAVSLSRFTRSGHLDKGQAEALLLANLPAGVSPNEHKIRGTIANGLAASVVPAFSPEQLGPGRA